MTTIVVVNNGAGSYSINGESNPIISLIRGNTYNLVINAAGHPFWIQTTQGFYTGENIYTSGVSGNGTQSGTILFVVPTDAPNTLYYSCQFHSSMQGSIIITDPTPTITNFSIPTQNYSSGATFIITQPSSNSTGAFSYASSNTNIATVFGSTVTILQAGTITITATQAADDNYTSGTATTSLIINTTIPIITNYSTVRLFSMSSSFTNNAQIYYKPNSLSTGGGGSGVKNHRHKQRRT